MALTGEKIKLVKQNLENTNRTVPVGKPIITNDVPEGAKTAEKIQLNDFITYGPQGTKVGREPDSSTVDFNNRLRLPSTIKEIKFNEGTLIITKANKDTIKITGFPVQSDFGSGIKGERGERGLDGKDGKDGPEGDKGERGEKGPLGLKGDKGYSGKDGEDGEKGITGLMGDKGEDGPQGNKGKLGIIGFEGAIGPAGDITAGEKGPTGDSPDGSAIFDSQPKGLLWAKPVS